MLALEGLVEWDAYRGVTVARDLRGSLTLADLFELRGALELLAVRVGAAAPDAAAIRELEEAEAEARRAERSEDLTRWPLANSRFHAGLVLLARSELLTQLMGIVSRASMFFPSIQSLRVHNPHEAIIKALKAGDADRALKLVADHARSNVATADRETRAHARLKNGSAAGPRRVRQRKR